MSDQSFTVNYIIHNSIYALMIILGSGVFLAGSGLTATGIIFSLIYFVYGILGSLWIILFMCPYCMLYNSRKCPCGYGVISGKLRSRGDHSLFREKFRKHIPVIVPLWFIPSAAGVLYLISEYSHIMLVLLILFCIQAFLILPLYSKYHGCRDCPQKEECSWMKQQTHKTGNKE